MAGLPSGSHLVISHVITDLDEQSVGAAARGLGPSVTPRTRAAVSRFFDGLDLVAPGLAMVDDWQPDDVAESDQVVGLFPEHEGIVVPVYVGVARKP